MKSNMKYIDIWWSSLKIQNIYFIPILNETCINNIEQLLF